MSVPRMGERNVGLRYPYFFFIVHIRLLSTCYQRKSKGNSAVSSRNSLSPVLSKWNLTSSKNQNGFTMIVLFGVCGDVVRWVVVWGCVCVVCVGVWWVCVFAYLFVCFCFVFVLCLFLFFVSFFRLFALCVGVGVCVCGFFFFACVSLFFLSIYPYRELKYLQQ